MTRKVVTRSPHRRVGIIPCPWLQSTPVEYESLLERDFVRLALFSPGLIAVYSQPFKIDLGEVGTYTPDFLLSYPQSMRLVVEVKPNEFSKSEKNQKLFAAVAQRLQENGFEFCIATDARIRKRDRHENAAVLLRYARSHFVSADVQRALAYAHANPEGISIEEVCVKARVRKELILHLIGQRKLSLNRNLDFSSKQIVRLISKGDGHGNLHPAAWLNCENWATPL